MSNVRRKGTLWLSAFLVTMMCLLAGCEKDLVPSFSQAQPHWRNIHGPFVLTQWGQEGPYASLTPRHEALGCWSVAFAQVLAYHHLQPRGQVSYKTRNGTVINENLDAPVDWDRVVRSIKPETPAEDSLETARYCYRSAVVVQKDFGRGEYMDVSIVPKEVSEHYGCAVKRVESDLVQTVKSELSARRPVVAYFDDILDIGVVRNGHAAIFDGVAEDKGRVVVHVNFGWGNASDGWYDFNSLAQDRELRYVFVIAPS